MIGFEYYLTKFVWMKFHRWWIFGIPSRWIASYSWVRAQVPLAKKQFSCLSSLGNMYRKVRTRSSPSVWVTV